MIDKRINLLESIITLTEFKEKFRKIGTSFTRNRKLPFAELVFFLINSCKKSLQIEIDNFFKIHEKSLGLEKLSKDSKNEFSSEIITSSSSLKLDF